MTDIETKRRGRIVISIVLVVILGVIGAGAAYVWVEYGDRISRMMGWTTIDYEGEGQGEAMVTISEGQIGSDIADTLAEADIVKTSEAFYELLLSQTEEVHFQVGTYRLKQQMSAQAALTALQDPSNRVELSAMIPEGRTLEQTLQILSDGTDIPVEEFEAAVSDPQAYGVSDDAETLEGWLFPATYQFDHGSTANDIIAELVGAQIRTLDELGVAEDDRQRVLTEAAIVQKESGHPNDFGKIARVIKNRLDIDMLLQMDSTAQYGYGQHEDGSVWSTDEALEDDNPYNTYVHKGLPIAPISNPGREAIAAVLDPEPGDWLYFVVAPGGTGESTFSETLEAHDAAVAEYSKWCAETPNSGC